MRLFIASALFILALSGCNQATTDKDQSRNAPSQSIMLLEARVKELEKSNKEMQAEIKWLEDYSTANGNAISQLSTANVETAKMIRDMTADDAEIAREQAGR